MGDIYNAKELKEYTFLKITLNTWVIYIMLSNLNTWVIYIMLSNPECIKYMRTDSVPST